MRHRHPTSVVLLALLLALVLPATSLACPIAIRTIGPLDITRADLRWPVDRKVTRAAWGLDDSWVATRPRLSQFVKIRGQRARHGVSFRTQKSLSIDARGPFDSGWMYLDDDDASTPPCAMVGLIEWQRPKIRVRQDASEVRISASSQRTVGDRTGCVLGPDLGVRECPNLTRTIVGLAKPLGNRALVFEQWP